MLRYVDEPLHADRLTTALYNTLIVKKIHTADIGGTAKTSEIIEGVIDELKQIFDKEHVHYF